MSRRGGDHTSRAVARGGAILLLALLAAPPVAAVPRSGAGIELPASTRQTLLLLQEQWSQWVRAFYQSSSELSDKAVTDLLVTSRQLGMQRLPDLSLGASARAVEAAADGDFRRALWALDAAERLDPGRPETAFAGARVRRLAGEPVGAIWDLLRGYARLFAVPALRRIVLHGAAAYALVVALAAGALFIALQMAARGRRLIGELAAWVARWLPSWVAYPAAVVLLLWPLLLPSGLLWLLVYWSVLLWGYGSGSERAVLVALWLLLGVTPLVMAEQRLRVSVAQSPPARALDALATGRLYGELFTDLGSLPTLFPDSAAVRQLLADFYRRLGSWESAFPLYRDVQDAEPHNATALLDLGAYYFYKGDYGGAVRYFKSAAAADPEDAAPYFNLSQAYSETYHFGESSAALAQARALDPERAGAWVSDSGRTRVLTLDGGFGRAGEIRADLLAVERGQGTAAWKLAQVRRWAALATALGVALAGFAVYLMRRGSSTGGGGESAPGPWITALLPGYASAVAGRGFSALGALLPAVALALLPLAGRIGYPPPLGFSSGELTLQGLAVAGLVALLGLRLWRELRRAA